tara:strand:- start:317 stop:961 length:645 start_codon:yes stop_codon:yes gene_type:complete
MSERVKVQGGKLYTRVVDRLTAFKGRFPVGIDSVLIHTEIHTLTDSYVVFKATISEGDTILATGHGFNAIAKEKAFEKAETVAVGRALAFFDPQYGGESELASQEEMEKFAELTKDDGSQFPPTQPKRNQDLLNGQVDKAMKQMNGESNGNGDLKDSVCNFKKYKGMQWSEVALIDTVDDKGKAEIGTDYMKWIKTNVKDLDTDTLEILNQYIG